MSVDLQIDNGIPLQRPRPRTELDVLLDIADQLVRLTAEIQHLRSAIGTTSKSSAEVKTAGQKGAVDGKIEIAIKAFAESPVDEAITEAIAGFKAAFNEIEKQQMNGWQESVDLLQQAKRASEP